MTREPWSSWASCCWARRRLLIAEAHLPTYGVLGLAGVVSLVAGGADRRRRRGRRAPPSSPSSRSSRCSRGAARGHRARHAQRRAPRVKTGRRGPRRPCRRRCARHRSPLGQVFVDGALWSARPCLRGATSRRRPGRRRTGQGPDALRAPGRGVGARPMTAVLVALVIIVAVVVAVAGASVRILREYERAVVFRLGRLLGAEGPGDRAPHPAHRPHGPRRPAHRHLRRSRRRT